MRAGEPSRTAYGAAAHRAVHQDLEGGRIFSDPLAWRVLGADREAAVARAESDGRRLLRLFIAVRHRFAEDSLATAVRRGTRQVVVLGAGLDTFAYRNPHQGLSVFEVDHRDTGAWKQQRLRAAGIVVPDAVVFVGVDFERDDLVGRLVEEGLDPQEPAFFLWLGVVPYLSPEAVAVSLLAIASIRGTEVVFDYPGSAPTSDPEMIAVREDLRRRTSAVGEPILSSFEPGQMADLLRRSGFGEVEDLGRTEILARFFGRDIGATDPHGGGHIVRARVSD